MTNKMIDEYEDINLTLRLHKNIITFIEMFSKTYFFIKNENTIDQDGYNDLLSTDDKKTNIKVSKKKIQDYVSHEITNDMKQLAGEVIADKEFPDHVKKVISKLLNQVIDIEEKESLK